MADDSEITTEARAEALVDTLRALFNSSQPAKDVATTSKNIAVLALEAQANPVYEERNRVLALTCFLASQLPGWKVGLGRHEVKPGETWDPAWLFVVFLEWTDPKQESFKFQASWHVHNSQVHLFASLPPYEGTWDGHTSAEKYRNIEAFIK